MYSPLRHMGHVFHKGRPIHLTFFVTRRCNAKCPFCFYLRAGGEDGSADRRPERSPELSLELSIDEIEKVSRSLGSLLWLAFSGGEIFLRDDLVEISRIFYRNNRPAVMLFPTNGLLPEIIRERTEQIAASCPKSVVTVKLSLDGIGEAHDRLRATPGSFDKTLRTCRLLGELVGRYPHFELGINTVFCSENQDRIEEIIGFVKKLPHVTTHTISMVRGTLSAGRYKDIDIAAYHRSVERLAADLRSGSSPVYRFRGARLKAAQDILQRRLISRTFQERKRLIPCYAGRLNLVLTERGDVFPCETLTDPLGNVREHGYDLERLCRSEHARNIVAGIRRGRCYCTHECYFLTNILFTPRLYPALAGEYARLKFRSIRPAVSTDRA